MKHLTCELTTQLIRKNFFFLILTATPSPRSQFLHSQISIAFISHVAERLRCNLLSMISCHQVTASSHVTVAINVLNCNLCTFSRQFAKTLTLSRPRSASNVVYLFFFLTDQMFFFVKIDQPERRFSMYARVIGVRCLGITEI